MRLLRPFSRGLSRSLGPSRTRRMTHIHGILRQPFPIFKANFTQEASTLSIIEHNAQVHHDSDKLSVLHQELWKLRHKQDVIGITRVYQEAIGAGITPSQETFAIILEVCAAFSNDIDQLLDYFHELDARNIGIDTRICNLVLQGLKRMSYTFRAYDEMKRIFDKMAAADSLCPPDAHSVAMLLYVSARRGLHWEVRELLNSSIEARRFPISQTLFHAIFAGYGERGASKRILEYMKQAKEYGFESDSVTYTSLIRALAQQRKLGSILKYFNKSLKDKVRPSLEVFEYMAHAFIKAEQYHRVLQLFQRMDKLDIVRTRHWYHNILQPMADEGNTVQLVRFYKQMVRYDFLQPNINTLNILLKGYGRGGNLAKMLNVWRKVRMIGFRPTQETIFTMLDGLRFNARIQLDSKKAIGQEQDTRSTDHQLGSQIDHDSQDDRRSDSNPNNNISTDQYSSVELLSLMTEILDVAMNDLNLEPTVKIYGALVAAYADHGDLESMLYWVRVLEEKGFTLTVDITNSLIRGYSSANRFESAFHTYSGILRPNEQSHVEMIRACASHKQMGFIHETCKTISSSGPVRTRGNVALFNEIVKAFFYAGDPCAGMTALDRMRDFQGKPFWTTRTWLNIIPVLEDDTNSILHKEAEAMKAVIARWKAKIINVDEPVKEYPKLLARYERSFNIFSYQILGK